MARWHLEPGEVTSGWEPVITEGAPDAAPGRRVWLRHVPTGIEVKATVPRVHGVPDEPPILEAELRKSLFAELELKVSRHLGK